MMAGKRPGKGRPPGRRGRGGVGPGPGYKPGGTGKGTRHTTGGCMVAKLAGATILSFLATALGGVVLAMVTA